MASFYTQPTYYICTTDIHTASTQPHRHCDAHRRQRRSQHITTYIIHLCKGPSVQASAAGEKAINVGSRRREQSNRDPSLEYFPTACNDREST